MTTKRETILAAARSALTGVSGVLDSNIFRARAVAFAKKDFPAIVLEPVNDQASNPNIHRLEWRMTFQVAVLVRSDAADTTADATVADVHQKIMSNSTLQALVTDIVPGVTSWQFIDADMTLGIILVQFIASYQTDLNTL